MISMQLVQGLRSLAVLLLCCPVSPVILGHEEVVVLEFYGLFWDLDSLTGKWMPCAVCSSRCQSQRKEGRGMNDAGELIITHSFNGLLSRMAGLDHLGILQEGRKILKKAKKQKTEPSMRVSEVIQLTGMTQENLEFCTSSCRLIDVVEGEEDPVISFAHVHCLVRIFSRFVREGVIL